MKPIELTLAVTLVGGACGPAKIHRFPDRAVLWQDDDRRALDRLPPAARRGRLSFTVASQLAGPLDRLLALGPYRSARNVNAMGEVPSSSWFANRNHLHRLTPAQMARGPNRTEGPSLLSSWQVHAAGRDRAGTFIRIQDEAGAQFVLRFDAPGWPDLATSSDIVATRLLHALGYHVPERHLVFVVPGELAPVEGTGISRRALAQLLRGLPRQPDGSLRAVATLVGTRGAKLTDLGPFAFHGRRRGDPNDFVDHERRRELRGLLPIAAWLNLTRITDLVPRDVVVTWRGRRYVVHHLWDLRSALGSSHAGRPKISWAGAQPVFDPRRLLLRLITLGAAAGPNFRRHRRLSLDRWPRLGWLPVRSFRPAAFRPHRLGAALALAGDRDHFWGARLVASITPVQIKVAITQAGLRPSDARRLQYLLVSRRRQVLRAFLARRAPVDRFAVRHGGGRPVRLCFDDLWTQAAGKPAPRAYEASLRSDAGVLPGWPKRITPGAGGRACLAVPRAVDGRLGNDDGYRVLSLRRRDANPSWARVHLRRRGARLVIAGIER